MAENSENQAEQRPTVAEAAIEGRTCKECHWFSNKYRNKLCSDNHKQCDPACSSFQFIQIKSDTIKNDPYIVAINEDAVNIISKDLNCIKNLLADTKGNEKEKISKIKLNLAKAKQSLSSLWRKAEAHIINNYSAFVYSFKDSNLKSTVIKDILESLTDINDEIDDLTLQLEQLTNNISSNDIKNDSTIYEINKEVSEKMSPMIDRSLIDELKNYYIFSVKMKDRENRPVPLHFNNANEWEILISLNEQCQAYKDRVLDILFSFTRVKQKLEKMHRQANAYIINNYSTFISNLKDSNQRNIIIDDILEPLTSLYEEIKQLSSRCEQTTLNLNSTSYSLREIKEIAIKVHDMRSASKHASI